MKKRRWITLALVTVVFSLLVKIDTQTSAAPKGPLPPIALKEQALNQAIQDLLSPDKYVRLEAGRTIARLAETPGIQRAIAPLILAESDPENREGILNRAMYIGALGPICRHLGSPVSDPTVDYLINHLLNNPSDYLRVSAAQALGITVNSRALDPLQTAIDSDPSPDVVMQAEVSLEILKRELEIVTGIAQGTVSYSVTTIPQTGSRVTLEEIHEYVETHFIVLGNQPLP